ncbi:MAG: hypothetical protein ACRD0F_08375, partial [Acidimicrobiales bacterium]
TRRLFDDEPLLLASFLLALAVYATSHLTRGMLSGNGQFRPYGALLAWEGGARVVACGVLFVSGFDTAGPYGLLLPAAPALAVAVIYARNHRGLMTPGPVAPWGELSSALGWLLAGSVLAQAFVNAGPLAVKLLASEAEKAVAGRFLAGLVIARVPLFLFQAVQASLLPRLAGLAAAGRAADFRTGLRRLVMVVAVIAVAATAGALAIGPFAVELLFGSEFSLGRRDLGLLAAASGAYMLALALAQALIALSGHARAALGWAIAVGAFAVVTAIGSDLLLRVETGLLAGSLVGAVAMGALLALRMRAGVPDTAELLVEALSPEREIIEP